MPFIVIIMYTSQGSTLRPESGLFKGFLGDGSESGMASPDCPDFFAWKTAPLPEWTLDWENG